MAGASKRNDETAVEDQYVEQESAPTGSPIGRETSGEDVPEPTLHEVAAAEEPTAHPVFVTKKPSHSKLFLAIIIIVGLLAAGLIWFLGVKMGELAANLVVEDQTVLRTTPAITVAANEELARFITPTTGEVWFAQPKLIDKQGWLKSEYRETFAGQGVDEASIQEQMAQQAPTYFEVGTRGDTTIIMAKVSVMIGTPYGMFFERSADGKVTAIAKPMSTASYDPEYYMQNIRDEIKTEKIHAVNETIHYDSLSVPSEILLPNGEVVRKTGNPTLSEGNMFMASGTTQTEIMKLGANTLYRTEKEYVDTALTNIGYYIKTAVGLTADVKYEPNTESLEKYTFDNGAKTTYVDYDGKTQFDALHAIARGCGGTTAAVSRSETLKESELTQVGKTDTGRAVYQPKDTNAALLKKAYEEYGLMVDTPISYDEFIKIHGLVVIKNKDGEFLVYVRDQYGPMGGCAKPVVYLYPTAATSVSVRVGAKVTVSDPLYPEAGWRGVVAQPSGALTYEGRSYESLFWEGQGYGEYPGIISGTVVKRADAAKTIRRQLAEQNLNQKESDDFMAFWESRIPQKPYIRLTWLNTAQMDRLAPLYISPKPDTVIRVFLDMDGFDYAVQLPAQKLTKVERKGFTVVEWGGLTLEGLR